MEEVKFVEREEVKTLSINTFDELVIHGKLGFYARGYRYIIIKTLINNAKGYVVFNLKTFGRWTDSSTIEDILRQLEQGNIYKFEDSDALIEWATND